MKIAVFTGNQPRHLALIEALAGCGLEVVAVQEATTVRPGENADLFAAGPVMTEYFTHVRAAETQLFGPVRPLPPGVRVLGLRLGDLPLLGRDELAAVLDCHGAILFGCSIVKGWLLDALMEKGALGLHMGLAPWYRGNSSNFWALYNRQPQWVGATIHRLDARVEGGPILFHALPAAEPCDPFLLGMRAVEAGILGLAAHLTGGHPGACPAVDQDPVLCVSRTRRQDFTAQIAREYLDRLPSAEEIGAALAQRPAAGLVQPFIAPSYKVPG